MYFIVFINENAKNAKDANIVFEIDTYRYVVKVYYFCCFEFIVFYIFSKYIYQVNDIYVLYFIGIFYTFVILILFLSFIVKYYYAFCVYRIN